MIHFSKKKGSIFIIFLFVAGFLLSGCYTGKNIIDSTPSGLMGIDKYTTVKVDDPATFVSVGGSLSINSPDLLSELGTRFQFGSFSKGIVSGNLQYKIGTYDNTYKNYTADQFVTPILFLSTYSQPLLVSHKSGKVKIPLNQGTAYTIDYNSPYLRIFSIEGGIGSSTSNFDSDLWAKQKSAATGAVFEDGFTRGNAIINQGNISGYLGIRLSHFLNTFISGTAENKKYSGRRKEVWDVRLGVKPLFYVTAPDIHYNYYIMQNYTKVYYDEYAVVSKFLKKSRLGFNFGISYSAFPQGKRAFSVNSFWEIGVEPGYMNQYSNTLYCRFGIFLGLGSKQK